MLGYRPSHWLRCIAFVALVYLVGCADEPPPQRWLTKVIAHEQRDENLFLVVQFVGMSDATLRVKTSLHTYIRVNDGQEVLCELERWPMGIWAECSR